VTGAQPNTGHRAVADLEAAGLVTSVITQNVDGLHQAAGSRSVIELHGNLGRVVCLDCGARTGRAELDHRLRAANRQWAATATAAHPDGDVTLDDDAVSRFRFVDCRTCGGILKPDVVFFGESVSRPTVEECYDAVAAAGSLLVLGSSLTVMSGLRFVRRAAKLGIPVVIVNDGPTRGDELATLRLHARLGTLLPILATAARDGTGSSGLWTRPGTAARVAR
jgi:NAD-dependent SIR2 family protein deacetylase